MTNDRLEPSTVRRTTGIVVAGVVLMMTPICGLLFGCGCDWPGLGLADRCNYFDASAPHRCPWCEFPALGFTAPLVANLFGLAAWKGIAKVPGMAEGRWYGIGIRVAAGLIAATMALWWWGQLTFLLTGYPRP